VTGKAELIQGDFLELHEGLKEISHYESLKPMIDKAKNDDRFDALVVPIGKGELVCRRK
jgi:hypothetical protein